MKKLAKNKRSRRNLIKSKSSQVKSFNPRALPLGRLTKRTPTHTPVPPNPAVEPLAVSFLNSFFWYELDLYFSEKYYQTIITTT
jgi:hypothetical protein